MSGDGLIARETFVFLRGNDEDFAPLRTYSNTTSFQ